MTPERFQEMRANAFKYREAAGYLLDPEEAVNLFEYIDTLLEDLRLTRQERDDAKHDCLEVRKANARLGEACIKAELEVAALRRGQGSAPEPAGPEHPPFHETHPIPDSTKGEQ